MNAHVDDRTIHDYLDGELGAAERTSLEDHATGCARCAERLADLAEVRTALGGLPRHGRPASDLWEGIRQRMEAGPDVVPLPGVPASSPAPAVRARTAPRRLAYAAGLILAFAAGALSWRVTPPAGEIGSGAPAVEAGVTDARLVTSSYEEAILDLEILLEEGRDRLDPVTVRTLEESLSAIDRAIREAEDALAADPGSELIRAMLRNQQRAKYRVLSRAADALLARS